MHAIEFHATIKDGAIAVPPEHLPLLTGGVTVIVMPDARPATSSDLIDQLLAKSRRVSGFQPLTRDESHAR